MDEYTDGQIRQELISFFGWKADDVYKLGAGELAAWKKHAIQLRRVGFWWFTDMPEKH